MIERISGTRISSTRAPRAALGFASAALGLLVAAFLASAPAWAGDYASVLIYHRFGESALPSTSVTLDQFDAHMLKPILVSRQRNWSLSPSSSSKPNS